MRALLAALLALPLALRAQPAVTPWGSPDEDRDWSEASCLAHLATTVCRYPNSIGPGFTFELEQSARPVADWEAGGVNYLGFRAFSLDRDEQGLSPEHLVVANHDAVSNGLGVSYWTLYLFDETPDGPVRRVSVPVQEFGPEGESFALDGDLVLWATTWQQGPDPSGQRGEGLYFVGRPFRIEEGRLVPATDHPVRARRFLDRFAEERGAGPPNPVAWLAHPDAEARETDPSLIGGEVEAFEGAVAFVEAQVADFGRTNWVLHIAADEASPLPYTYAFGYAADIERPFTHLGDAASGRLYPPGLLAADPVAWLEGRRVRVATYAGDGEPRVVVWLLE